MSPNPVEVICGKCGSKTIYNPEDKKEKCQRCGEWLYQYINEKEVTNISKDVKEISEKTQQRDTVICRKCKRKMIPIRHTGFGSGGRSLMCPLCGAGYSTFDYKAAGYFLLAVFIFLIVLILSGIITSKCSH